MKKIFQSIGLFFAHFFGDVEAWIEKHVKPSKALLVQFKQVVDSKAANLLVALTPTDADDKFRLFLSNFLTVAINAMNVSADILNEEDWTLKVVKTINYVKSLSPAMRNAFYARLESEIVKASVANDGQNVPGNVIDTLLQVLHTENKEADTLAALPEPSTAAAVATVAPTKKATRKKKVVAA